MEKSNYPLMRPTRLFPKACCRIVPHRCPPPYSAQSSSSFYRFRPGSAQRWEQCPKYFSPLKKTSRFGTQRTRRAGLVASQLVHVRIMTYPSGREYLFSRTKSLLVPSRRHAGFTINHFPRSGNQTDPASPAGSQCQPIQKAPHRFY